LGETLSLQGNIGNLARSAVFAFNEPYLRNKTGQRGLPALLQKVGFQFGAQLRHRDRPGR
jgi:hypothetical protein